MFAVSKNKVNDNYLKSHYITDYIIDADNDKIDVYYIDGSMFSYPLTSKSLNKIKRVMKEQYYEWRNLVKQAYMFNLVKILYLNIHLKKQKYYLEHENELNNLSIKKFSLDKKLSKGEINQMKASKKDTQSYFNLSSVSNYKLSTMKKISKIISVNKRSNQKVK